MSTKSEHHQLKPGQKFPTPTPGFGDRVFYETLLRQRPSSVMAQEWCVNYGVLSVEEASRLHNIILSRKGNKGVSTSPVKKEVGGEKTKVKRSTKKNKILDDDLDFDAEMGVGGGDGIGTTGL